ncbi:MAG: FAD-dependent oxidoreductase [Acidimicrobiales bacterium]
MSKSVTVIGAGPAGPMLAVYLANQGHNVTVYESRPDMREVDISAGRSINLALATRGIEPLRAIGVMDSVEPVLIPMLGRRIHERDGQQSVQPYGSQPHEYINSVSRSALNSILLDAAEATGNVTLRFNMRCRGIDLETNTLRFSNELNSEMTTTNYETVFGTDGSASVIREDLLVANGGSVDIAQLDHGYKELTLPAGVDGSFQIDQNALHIWPRGDFMLIALPDTGGSFTVTLFLANDAAQDSFRQLDTPRRVAEFFAEHFADFVALTPDLVEQFFENPHGRLATVRTVGWRLSDKVVLLGDAAHAVVPFHGEGMNAAFESCAVLDACMRQHPNDWELAFSDFETTRKPDTDAIAQMAIDNYVEMRSSVIDERYQLKRALALELERRWPQRFTPRYSMVMFHTMAYSEAQRRAGAQGLVLDRLTEGINDLRNVDWATAERLVAGLEVIQHMDEGA